MQRIFYSKQFFNGKNPSFIKQVFICLAAFFSFSSTQGQINIATTGTYNQDFNSLGSSSTAALPANWKAFKSNAERITSFSFPSGVSNVELAAGDNMSASVSNGIYRFNANSLTTESSLGGLSSSSNSKTVAFMVHFKNNAATPIAKLDIAYNVEKFRNGSNAAGFTIEMFYSTNGTSWATMGSDFRTSFSADANNNGFTPAPGSTVAVSKEFTLPAARNLNDEFYLAWRYSVTSGSTTSNAQALGFDDVAITAKAGGPTAPVLASATATSINTTQANLGATITADGGASITERGTVWGTAVNPVTNALAEGGTGVGTAYSHLRTGLTANTKYFSRGYAINSAGTGYSNNIEFTTLPLAPGILTGIDETTVGFRARWTHPSMGTEAYTYTVQVSTDNTFATIDATISGIASSNDNVVINTLASATDYYYRVRAVNTTGYSDWSTTSAMVTTLTPSCTAPNTSASGVAANTFTANSFNLSWTRGNGDNILVIARKGSAVNAAPVLGTNYIANASFGVGDQIGTGNFVVYNGNGTSVSLTSLDTAATYHFDLYEYNNVGYCYQASAVSFNASTKPVYLWRVGNGSFTTASNWSPSRTTPSASDILIFNSGSVTVTNVPTQTIAQLHVLNTGTVVALQSSANIDLTLAGDTGQDLIIDEAAELTFSGGSALRLFLNTGVSGQVHGTFRFSPTANHRLIPSDSAGCLFETGSLFIANGSGNPFGGTSAPLAVLNSVVFKDGSIFRFVSGSNPFGLTAPNSAVIFRSGSLYQHQSTNAPAFTNRVYADIEIDATVSVTGGTAVTFDNLLIKSGTFGLNMNAGANINGNITVESGATLNMSPTTTSNINFVGSETQLIENNGTLNVSNANWIVNGAGLQLETDITLGRNLSLTAGDVNTANNKLTLSSSSTLTETGGKILGRVETTRNAPQNTTTNFAGMGLTINPGGANMGSTLVARVTGEQLTGGSGPNTDNTSNLGIPLYFEVTPTTNAGLNATVVLTYDENDLSFAEANLVVYKRPKSGTNWVLVPGSTLNTTNNTLTFVVDSFSVLSPGDVAAPLPVQWLQVHAHAKGQNVQLEWATASEMNNHYFEVLHSKNGQDFTAIGRVEGAGTTSITKHYKFVESKIQTGVHYFMIRQVDFDGTSSNSKVVSIKIDGQTMAIYPNPGKQSFRLNGLEGQASLRVFNLNGQIVLSSQIQGSEVVDLPNLPQGFYWLEISQKGSPIQVLKLQIIE